MTGVAVWGGPSGKGGSARSRLPHFTSIQAAAVECEPTRPRVCGSPPHSWRSLVTPVRFSLRVPDALPTARPRLLPLSARVG